MAAWYHWQGQTLVIQLRLQPRARQDAILGVHGDALKIQLTAPPVDGKANRHLCEFLARLCKVPQARVTLLSGEKNRNKKVAIQLESRTFPEFLKPFC